MLGDEKMDREVIRLGPRGLFPYITIFQFDILQNLYFVKLGNKQ
jgi:hypothetical protein